MADVPPVITQSSYSDFNGGGNSGTVVSGSPDASVTLPGVANTTFSGNSVPAGWKTKAFGSPASTVFSGGKATLDGSYVSSDFTFTAGQRLDFTATFSGGAYQGVGFTENWGGDAPQPTFATREGGVLYAWVNSANNVQIPGSWFGTARTYRIDWLASKANFYIDNSLKATVNFISQPYSRTDTTSLTLRPSIADGNYDGSKVVVDSVDLTTIPRVLDTDFTGTTVPSGWTTTPYYGPCCATEGTTTLANGVLTSDGTHVSSDYMFTAGQRFDVTATFSGDPYQHIGFTQYWEGDTPQPAFSTREGGVLYAYVNSNNSVQIPGSWFGIPHEYRVDWYAARADFYIDDALVTSIDFISEPYTRSDANSTVLRPSITDGETGAGVLLVDSATLTSLVPAIDTGFDGTAMPAGWQFTPFYPCCGSTGSAPVGSSKISIEGGHVSSDFAVTPGQRVDVNAKFSGAPYQAIGFTNNWASGPIQPAFGTLDGGKLYAYILPGVAQEIPGNWFSSNFDYRIDWTATKADFYINNSKKAEFTFDYSGPLRLSFADSEVNSSPLIVNSVASTALPGAGAGTYTSKVIDAESIVDWKAISMSAFNTVDSNATLSYRTGNTPTPDSSWVGFTPAGPGATITRSSRYIQYRLSLKMGPSHVPPSVHDVSVFRHLSMTDTTTSDFTAGSATGTEVSNDSNGEIRLLSTTNTGSFESRIFQSPDNSAWSRLSWSAATPSDSSLLVKYRVGDTSTPDGSWTSYVPAGTSGSVVSPGRKYLQYKVELQRATTGESPVVSDVTVRT